MVTPLLNAHKRGAGDVVHNDTYKLPDLVVLFVEDHDFILPCSPEVLISALLGKALN